MSSAVFKAVRSRLDKSITIEKASASFASGSIILEEAQKIVHVQPLDPSTSSRRAKTNWEHNGLYFLFSDFVPLVNSPNSPVRLRQLVADCELAEFGRGQESVLDPKYRKAGKLAPHQFSSSFHLADFGIVDRVEQILLPTLHELDAGLLRIRGIGMKLYKLNIS